MADNEIYMLLLIILACAAAYLTSYEGFESSPKTLLNDIKGKKDHKIELKNVSLTTSKTNYIDPRITIAFLKRHNIPMEKIFSQTLIDKFFWAIDVDKNWKF